MHVRWSVSAHVHDTKESRVNIYVGNLSNEINEDDLRQAFEAFGQVASVNNEDDLRQAFEAFGQVASVNVLKRRFTGEPRGFAFVEMPAKAEAQSAINGLNGKELKGRSLNVNEARPRPERGGGGGKRG
jgi:RNA recognition motif-containing protein